MSQAIAHAAGQISLGVYDLAIAAGVESMSSADMSASAPDVNWQLVQEHDLARACTIPMGITSENVAKKYGITREAQDMFALESHRKAARARDAGEFHAEIVPVPCSTGAGSTAPRLVEADDGIRADTSVELLSSLKPAFDEHGTTTAGNSSQVSDGAAAVLVARQSFAAHLGLPVLGVLRAYAVVGVPPDVMGVGPAYAIPEAVRKAGLCLGDIDVFEINEAFASQCLYCINYLGIPMDKVNPCGGAIALGHPLGCTGARQAVTLLHYMQRHRKRFGVVSMCIGTGMGAAAVFENPDCS